MRGNVVGKLMRTLRRALAAFAVFALGATPALAQGSPDPYGLAFGTATGLATGDIREMVGRIINAFLGLLGLLAVCLVLYAGFLWMTARGDEEQVAKAKALLRNAVIGLIIIVMSYAIVAFVVRAITGGGTGTYQGCPPGQVCGTGGGGFGGGGGAGGFRVTGVMPAGAGPSNGGWPKNYAIAVSFNASINAATATPASVVVRRCNARVGIGRGANAFDSSACGDAIAASFAVDGPMLRIAPTATPGDQPTDFEGDYWYAVRVQGGAIRDAAGRTLVCPLQTIDISSTGAGVDYCERAVAFNDLRDVAPPTVAINAPASPPAYCASDTQRVAPILAVGNDDFLVAAIDFVLDGGTANLLDAEGNPLALAPNASLTNPFAADSIFADLMALAPGTHTIAAVARDGAAQSSAFASRDFSVVPSSCCNAVMDQGEVAVDCGGTSACGACSGGSCATGADCASGFCNAQGRCEERPFIQAVSPLSGGPGTMVTISGTGFGGTQGSVVFLGADTDGNNDPEGDADDVIAAPCAPQAWTVTQVVVAVPSTAVSGPLKLVTAPGPTDRSDDASGPSIGSFAVTTETLPGICYLAPSTGAPGAKFAIHGAGFGASASGSATFGPNALTIASCALGAQECGWTDSTIWAVAPPVKENAYQVKVTASGEASNSATFVLRTGNTTDVPRITAIVPENGPVGSYVTIQGTGFGGGKGLVRFTFGEDEAIATDPVCDDTWHDTYIIVKVPDRYADGTPINVSGAGMAHKIEVVTAPPSRTSAENVSFGVTNGPARPGICRITPDNGPPGSAVVVEGEGFGAGPGVAAFPRYSVEFFKSQAKRCLNDQSVPCTNVGETCSDPTDGVCAYASVPANGYSSWSGAQISTVVAGETTDKTTWPASGPVFVVSDNLLSANAVPFTVQDCNENGGRCAEGQICCASGSCQSSCGPLPRESAYGWRFSTDVLPTLPVVIERAQCDITSDPTKLQSPSPYKNSTDACVNAQNYVAFSRRLDTATFTADTIKMEECGTGQSPSCTTAVSLAPFTSVSFADCDSLNLASCAALAFRPSNAYNAGGNFKKNTWYRVTLVSDLETGVGIREVGDGRFLDGDNDKRQGGNYVLNFRVRDTDLPCQISGAGVIASSATIEQDTDPVNFSAALVAGNCNMLRCDAGQPVILGWTAEAAYLNKLGVLNGGCTQPVRAIAETLPGATTPLDLEVTPTGTNAVNAVRASSDIVVAFADPRVVSVTPAAKCEAACINAAVGATFNIPMDAQSISSSTVELRKCRNSSCNAPFAPDLNGVTASVTAPVDGIGSDGFTSLHKSVRIVLSGNLEPDVWYIARIKGGDGGVMSASGVPLSGLNDGGYYSWIFKTKNDPTACAAARTAVVPESAMLKYEGQRVDLVATPFGSPDACSEGGQELNALSYDWRWSIAAPNAVVQGFIDGIPPYTPDTALANPGVFVDRAAAPRLGCTDRCLPAGSQNRTPQCGNGRVDTKYEECDDGNQSDADGCSAQCLRTGSRAPKCGDGTIESAAGETCDMVQGVFPPGCKAPGASVPGIADDVGCVFIGSSSAYSSSCGDGVIGDGESCDDGNASNGDGCNASCLHEGTLRSCLDVAAGRACVNFCGNGRAEPGEDAACEPNPSAAGCSPSTCLKLGSATCGNGTVEAGEDALCETDPLREEICTDRCLLKGSSSMYAEPSFCGDGIAGKGEYAMCEASVIADGKADASQTAMVMQQSGQSGDTSTVIATVDGVPTGAEGSAAITLEHKCGTLPPDQQDAYCASIAPPGVQLGCSADGVCTKLPTVVQFQPTSYAACRNAEVRVVFSHRMDEESVRLNMQVGYDNGTAACPNGTTEVGPVSRAKGGFFARVWNGIVTFVRNYVLRPAFGAPPSAPTAVEQGHRFCSIEGTVTVVTDGVGEAEYSVAYFAPRSAMPAQKYIRAHIATGARTASGVNFPAQGFTQYFATGRDICQVQKVSVTPAFVMLADANASQAVTAHAVGPQDQAIVPTADYAWTWEWTPTSSTAPIVIAPRLGGSASCTLPSACVDPSGCECRSGLTSCTVAQNATSCASSTSTLTAVADVRARDAGVAGRASDGPVPVEATAVIGSGTNRSAISSIVTTDSGYALMLCADPWPQYQRCVNGKVTPPWDKSNPRDCTGDTWLPFTDPATSTQLYYCRAIQTSGDTVSLPCLKEAPARVTQVGPGILQEYLFTFDASSGNCPGGPSASSAEWLDDAVGLRVSQNLDHVSVGEWYRQRGFRGNPQPALVDGYDALQEGRTTYVGTASKSADQRIFTNVNTFSYNDGASPETVAVFGQLLRNVNFNATADMADVGLCRANTFRTTPLLRCNTDEDCRVDATGKVVEGRTYTCDTAQSVCMDGGAVVAGVGRGISCETDLECRVDTSGKAIPGRNVGFCDIPKTKLVRDVRRWADLQSIRTSALSRLTATGKTPTLEAGSFLRGRSVSVWPSWATALSAELGAPAPTDPVNRHGVCDGEGIDPITCWNAAAGAYTLPPLSHVYGFETLGPTDFRLSAVLEYGQTEPGVRPRWSGTTCNEKDLTQCAVAPECAIIGGLCEYKTGKISLTSPSSPFSSPATATSSYGPGRCGDGVRNAGEACEPGETKVDSCTAVVDGKNYTGARSVACTTECTWQIPGACQVGRCGDGVVQAPESCDDGRDNGKYGYCNAGCTGRGFFCGDGAIQPGETCDCAEKNGQYFLNGVIAPAGASCGAPSSSTASCSWDCAAAGPRCGDGVVNGGESCDGGIEEYKGYCSDAAQTGCNIDADCPSGAICGNFCQTVEEKNRRTCRVNAASSTADDATACSWNAWECVGKGSCGNGIKETGEQCDDGNDSDADACTKSCKLAACGDAFVQPGTGETCDLGLSDNGRLCSPDYGSSCTYCSAQCKTATVTGPFCGDGDLQSTATVPQGPEQCDGTQGLGGYVCVENLEARLSTGFRASFANGPSPRCATNSCNRECPENADLCENGTSGPDTDGDAQGLRDVCDPDDDNDRVPDGFDCGPKDPDMHGDYSRAGQSVAAAQEICDGKDNDCNGDVDNIYTVSGTVINARTGDPLPNASFSIRCGTANGETLVTRQSNQVGEFLVEAKDPGTCDGKFVIMPENNAEACGDPADAVTIDVSTLTRCVEKNIGKIVAVPKPGSTLSPGAVATVFLQWGEGQTPPDIDFHVKSSTGQHLFYNATTAIPEIKWDKDNISESTYPANRLETITFNSFVAGKAYKIFMYNYPSNWNSLDWGSKSAVVKYYDSSCTLKKWSNAGIGGSGAYWNVMTIVDGAVTAEPNTFVATEPTNP